LALYECKLVPYVKAEWEHGAKTDVVNPADDKNRRVSWLGKGYRRRANLTHTIFKYFVLELNLWQKIEEEQYPEQVRLV